MSQTRSQSVARRAYELVAARRTELDATGAKKYLSFARAFPTLVHQCGVCQAAAFALAKKKEHEQVLDDVARVLAGYGFRARPGAGADLDGHARAADTGAMHYLRLTRDVLAAAGWVKRYAEAVLAEGDDASGADTN